MKIFISFLLGISILISAENFASAGMLDVRETSGSLYCAKEGECELKREYQQEKTTLDTSQGNLKPSGGLSDCLENGKCDTELDEEFSQTLNQIQVRMIDLESQYRNRIYTELLCFAGGGLLGGGVGYSSENALSGLLTFYVGSTICRYGTSVLR